MTSSLDPRVLLAANTSWHERLLGRTVRLWVARAREVRHCWSAFTNPFPVVSRIAHSGPWPFRAALRDKRSVTLTSNRDAWMYAHSFGGPEFSLFQLRTREDGVSEFEFVSAKGGSQTTLELPPGIGDAGIFLSGEYKSLPVEGRTVVDVGAGGGETALYFILKGATRVVGFEPHPNSFQSAQHNIEQNRCGDRVFLERKAVGANSGVIRLHASRGTATDRALTSNAGEIATPVTTLTQIVSDYKIAEASLKVDCEGDEYALIQRTPAAVLHHFRDIMIEYHFGHRSLSAYLESAGFSVRAGSPTYSPRSARPGVYYGPLIAHRKNPEDG